MTEPQEPADDRGTARCPFCHESIAERADGVRCAACAAPHHRACWEQHGKCSVFACETTKWLPYTRRAAARIVLGAGKRAVTGALRDARERLGGKGVVGLVALTCFVAGIGLGPLLHTIHRPKLALEVVLGTIFTILTAWITYLLHRGVRLEQDLALPTPVAQGPQAYLGKVWGGLTGSSISNNVANGPSRTGRGCWADGCGDPGCGNVDADGFVIAILVVAAVALLIFVILPLVAWLAIEVIYPLAVIAIYMTLYSALAFAVNVQDALKGRPLLCLARAAMFSAFYTALVAGVMLGGWAAFHHKRPLVDLPAEAPASAPGGG